jgi:mevalonate kinase
VDARERQEIVEDLLSALQERGAAEGMKLLELVRLEQTLMDALAFVRREIDAIARATQPPPGGGG